jgi:integrase/recombinase XerD
MPVLGVTDTFRSVMLTGVCLKAWSQNLGHEGVLTTFSSYGPVSEKRQAELIKDLASRPITPDAASALAAAAIGVLRQLGVRP